MSRSKRGGKRSPPPSAELHSDDGVDPREFLSRVTKSRSDHHVSALCSEVWKRLSLVFSADLDDEELLALEVVAVEPAPDSSRLRVVLSSPEELDLERRLAMLARLKALTPFLRSEIAQSLARRRTPDLGFEIVDLPRRGGTNDEA